MRWLTLAFAAFFCLGLCCDEHNGPDGQPPDGDNGPDGNGEPAGPPEVIDTQYVRLPVDQERQFTWTSTGAGTLTAGVSWQGTATLTVYLAKGGVVATESGSSPLDVSAHVGGAGEVWTIGMQNPSSTGATASYTLTFQPD
jgi:hypothetical protein